MDALISEIQNHEMALADLEARNQLLIEVLNQTAIEKAASEKSAPEGPKESVADGLPKGIVQPASNLLSCGKEGDDSGWMRTWAVREQSST